MSTLHSLFFIETMRELLPTPSGPQLCVCVAPSMGLTIFLPLFLPRSPISDFPNVRCARETMCSRSGLEPMPTVSATSGHRRESDVRRLVPPAAEV